MSTTKDYELTAPILTYNETKVKIIEEVHMDTISLSILYDQEYDGRWIAQVPELPGVLVYGNSQDEATANIKALALETLGDQIKHGETRSQINQIYFVAA